MIKMKTSEFMVVVEDRIRETIKTLTNKGNGYASEKTRFTSFHRAGEALRQSTTKALDGMWVKHRVSIAECIDKMEADPNFVPTKKWIKDKLGDNINYTLLLEGLIEERRRNLENTNVSRHEGDHPAGNAESESASSLLSSLDSDEADRIVKEHIQELAEIYSGRGSHESARACIDNFRSKWGIKVTASSVN